MGRNTGITSARGCQCSNACLAVTIDTGDPDNIHSKDKQPVGERLALCALAKYYSKNVVYSGPTLASVERLPSSIRLHFANAAGGLVVKERSWKSLPLPEKTGNGIGPTRTSKAIPCCLIPSVPNPKEVRYAWQSNPAATLFNGAGLPAGPFRTDTWPGITESQRPY